MAPQSKEVNREYKREWRKNNRQRERDTGNARYRKNLEKSREYQREWRHESDLKTRYGATVEEYNAKFTAQSGLCAICERSSTRRLCWDHNHATKRGRQLLCHSCNLGLGSFEDSPILLERAAAYLKAHGE